MHCLGRISIVLGSNLRDALTPIVECGDVHRRRMFLAPVEMSYSHFLVQVFVEFEVTKRLERVPFFEDTGAFSSFVPACVSCVA
jgi:hypothetical protein